MNDASGRRVRAVFDAFTITVYQAYGAEIADAAIAAGRFVPPFSLGRMTWIKPSFLWMMYRCGWATKPGQERVLAIQMLRSGFEEALSSAVLSHFDASLYSSEDDWRRRLNESAVRVQWDPERTVTGAPLPYRSLQVGLSGWAARRYVSDWVVGIADVTEYVHQIHETAGADPDVLPKESEYPLTQDVAVAIGADHT